MRIIKTPLIEEHFIKAAELLLAKRRTAAEPHASYGYARSLASRRDLDLVLRRDGHTWPQVAEQALQLWHLQATQTRKAADSLSSSWGHLHLHNYK